MFRRENLRSADVHVKSALENISDAEKYPSVLISYNGLILNANRKFADASGYAAADLVEKRKWSDFIYSSADLVDIAFKRIIRNAEKRESKDITGFIFIDRFGNINSLRLRILSSEGGNTANVIFMIGGCAEEEGNGWFSINQVTSSIVQSMISRDAKLVAHHIEVSTLSHSICTAMNLSEDESRLVYCGSMLHDIGKIFVCGSAQSVRYEEHEHCISGYNILKNISSLDSVPLLVLQHHDHCSSLSNHEDILGSCVEFSLLSQIIAVSEAIIESKEKYEVESLSPDFFQRKISDSFDRELIKACSACLCC